MVIELGDKRYNGAAFLDQLIKRGVPADAVVIKTHADGTLFVDVRKDDARVEKIIREEAVEHDPDVLSEAENVEQDRERLIDAFNLDASDRDFIVALSSGFEAAVANDASPSAVYDGIRAIVENSPKHRDEIAKWYGVEIGGGLLGELTTDEKREFVKCVRRYYATRLAPALVAWLTR